MALTSDEIGRRIRTVREELGVSVQELASACGINNEAFERLEAGTLEPIPGDYILIAARMLKTDFRYFISDVLDDVERETRRLFRAMDDPQVADLVALRRFMLFCMAEQDLETLLECAPRSLPPEYPRPGAVDGRAIEQGRRAARDERQRLGLGVDPIRNVFALLRQQDVRLFRHALADARISGVTVAHPRAGVCVLVNYEEDLYRQFFSAAHEYAHVLFDRAQIANVGFVVSYRFTANQLIELRANAFAGEFLLPGEALSRYNRPKGIAEVAELIRAIARNYRVNTETVAIQMKEAGWITQKTLASFRKVKPVVIHRHEKVDPDLPATLTAAQVKKLETAIRNGFTAHFLELLRRGVTENAITFGRFAEMLDMTVDDAREFAQSVGMATQ